MTGVIMRAKQYRRLTFLSTIVIIAITVLPLPVWAGAMELYYQANNFYWNRQYTRAIDVYQSILRDHPQSELRAKIYFSLGSAYFEIDKYEKAATWYEKVLRESVDDNIRIDGLFRLGQCYLQTGNYQRAGEVFENLVSDFPQSLVFSRASLFLERAREGGYRRGGQATETTSTPVTTTTNTTATTTTPVRNTTATPVTTSVSASQVSADGIYTVKRGESLSLIAENLLGAVNRFREIALLNDLVPPYRIVPGQQLRIPGFAVSVPPALTSVLSTGTEEPDKPVPTNNVMNADNLANLQRDLDFAVTRIRQLEEEIGTATAITSGELRATIEQQMRQRYEQQIHELELEREELQAQLRALARRTESAELISSNYADTLTMPYEERIVRLEYQVAAAAELRNSLMEREEQLRRTQSSFDELHESYQAIEAELQNRDNKIDSHEGLNNTLVNKIKMLEAAFAELEEAYNREQAASEARTRTLTESYEEKIIRLTEQLTELQQTLEVRDEELSALSSSRETIEARLNRFVSQEEENQEAMPLIDQARKLRQAGRFAESAVLYQQALAKNPESADALNGLAYLYAEMGENLDEAKALIERAIARNPQGKGYYLDTLGWIYYREDNQVQAENNFSEALELLPNHDRSARAVVSYHLGLSYFKQGNRDKAFFAFVDTINLAPGSSYASEAQSYLSRL